ncbi:putative metal-binding protein [Thermoplasmatales archaeon BRNA1]|nr:putative metal-binding protein [Thermoplasmatales archaeon BRNA1]
MNMMDKWIKYVGEDGVGFSLKDATVPKPTKEDAEYCRKLCEQNACHCYGVTWGCPPGAGTLGECLSALKKFSKAVIVYCKFKVDHKDRVMIDRLSSDTQTYIRKFNNGLRSEGYKTLALADGGCNNCDHCRYPEACDNPDQRVPSISAYGIIMMQYLEDNGLDFKFEDGYVTLYGIVLYNEPTAD